MESPSDSRLQFGNLICDRRRRRRRRRRLKSVERCQSGRGVVSIEIVRFQRFTFFTQRRILSGAVALLLLVLLMTVTQSMRGRIEADHVAASRAAIRMVQRAKFTIQSRVLTSVDSEPLMTDSSDRVNACRS